jgi:hypothetical protein
MRRLALLAAAVCAWSCGGTPGPVALSGGWPERPPDYGETHERWTRHADARKDLARVLDVFATLKSHEWRAARAADVARRFRMSDEARTALENEERAAADAHWEVELVIATQRDWADFNAGKRSMWRIVLEGDGGREVAPLSIVEDNRPRSELEHYYPDMTLFHRAWIAKFPKNASDGQPLVATGDKLILEISSAQTGVELVWRGK